VETFSQIAVIVIKLEESSKSYSHVIVVNVVTSSKNVAKFRSAVDLLETAAKSVI